MREVYPFLDTAIPAGGVPKTLKYELYLLLSKMANRIHSCNVRISYGLITAERRSTRYFKHSAPAIDNFVLMPIDLGWKGNCSFPWH